MFYESETIGYMSEMKYRKLLNTVFTIDYLLLKMGGVFDV